MELRFGEGSSRRPSALSVVANGKGQCNDRHAHPIGLEQAPYPLHLRGSSR